MTRDEIISWLLEGDVSIQYQTYRDLLGEERTDLKERIPHEGWGRQFLSNRGDHGHWGDHFYQPKWTSTHYTILDIRHLDPPPDLDEVRETIERVSLEGMGYEAIKFKGPQGARKDLCVNGMFLNYASYFGLQEEALHTIVDYLLDEQMEDGGFNCRSTRSKCVHSSVHSTISIMEGLWEYWKNAYKYRREEVSKAHKEAGEFLLMHRLFKSDRTGEIIHPGFLTLSYPSRWKYNILRALDHFQICKLGNGRKNE